MAQPLFLTLDRQEQRIALEAMIFASEDAVTPKQLFKLLVLEELVTAAIDDDEADGQLDPRTVTDTVSTEAQEINPNYFIELVNETNQHLELTGRPYRIVQVAGGFQFVTMSSYGELVQRLIKTKSRRRLSQAALESLAIIAYRQPITKPEIEAIRGVKTDEVVNALIEKTLVAVVGRAEGPGKPLLYGTTEEFLRSFKLNTLYDLPKLKEIDELLRTAPHLVQQQLEVLASTGDRKLRERIQPFINEELQGANEGGKMTSQPLSIERDEFDSAFDTNLHITEDFDLVSEGLVKKGGSVFPTETDLITSDEADIIDITDSEIQESEFESSSQSLKSIAGKLLNRE